MRTENTIINFQARILQNNNKLEHLIVVCTQHKTGTIWLKKIFAAIACKQQLNLYSGKQSSLPLNTNIFFQEHSMASLDKLGKHKGLHIIRDPRDIIVSGCFYHAKSDEAWLHQPQKWYGNMTYHQKINSFNTFEERLFFEMDNCASWTINQIAEWDYQQTDMYEVKYEDLIVDRDLFIFHQIFHFLGFTENILLDCMYTAYENSLFSGKVSALKHIRSGKAQQWKSFFNSAHKSKFKAKFGDLLVHLGYEKDNNW